MFPWFFRSHASEWFALDREAAGIPKTAFRGKVDFHALRVTHVTLGIELGFDAKTAQTLARHKSVDMTMNTYAKVNPERLRKAVNALDQAVRGAEAAQESQNAVKTQALPIAVGAESLSQTPNPPAVRTIQRWCRGGDLNP